MIVMECPHCLTRSYVRSSSPMTRTSRELVLVCKNHECGHSFVAILEVNRTISPSAVPDPKVVIPFSRHIRFDTVIDQLERFPRADHRPMLPQSDTADMFDDPTPATPPAEVPAPG